MFSSKYKFFKIGFVRIKDQNHVES